MKLVYIIGNAAVGKMSVGHALMERTGLRLFHNHMTIEPVLEIFGHLNGKAIKRMRDMIFVIFAKSRLEGLIFSFMWAFDQQEDLDYVAHVTQLFEKQGADS